MERLHAVLFHKDLQYMYRRANTAVSCKLSQWRIQEIFGNKRKMDKEGEEKGRGGRHAGLGPSDSSALINRL